MKKFLQAIALVAISLMVYGVAKADQLSDLVNRTAEVIRIQVDGTNTDLLLISKKGEVVAMEYDKCMQSAGCLALITALVKAGKGETLHVKAPVHT